MTLSSSKCCIPEPYPLQTLPLAPPHPSRIPLHPPDFTFRVLGIQYNINLNPTIMTRKLQQILIMTLIRISASALTLPQSSYVLREFLYPKLELGLIYLPPPQPTLKIWDRWILQNIFRKNIGPHIRSLNNQTKWISIGLPPVSTYANIAACTNCIQSLRSAHPPSSKLKVVLLRNSISNLVIRTTPSFVGFDNLRGLDVIALKTNDPNRNSISRAIQTLNSYNLTLCFSNQEPMADLPPPHAPDSVLPLSLQSTPCVHLHQPDPPKSLQIPHDSPISFFSDGSAQANSMCGYAVIMIPSETLESPNFDFKNITPTILHGSSPYAGQNWTAELLGILRALYSVPLQTPVSIYSDALSALLHLSPLEALSEGTLLRLGSGSIMRQLRKILQARLQRQTPTSLNYIPAHTENTDIYSKGNDLADVEAKAAASDEDLNENCKIPFTHNSENSLIVIQSKRCQNGNILNKHFDGNLRDRLLHNHLQNSLDAWKGLPSQGLVAQKNPKPLLELIKYLRNHHNNTLLHFLLLASTQQLPTANRLLYALPRYVNATICPLCTNEQTSTLHALRCPRLKAHRLELYSRLQLKITHIQRHIRHSNKASLLPLQEYSPTVTEQFQWYDPTYQPDVNTDSYFGQNAPASLQPTFLALAQEHHPLSACIGILPEPLQLLLYPLPSSLGLPPALHNQQCRHRLKELRILQIQILTTTYKLFKKWQCITYQHYRHNPQTYSKSLLDLKPGHLYRNFNH